MRDIWCEGKGQVEPSVDTQIEKRREKKLVVSSTLGCLATYIVSESRVSISLCWRYYPSHHNGPLDFPRRTGTVVEMRLLCRYELVGRG
jgi:hypothetical protein